MRYVPNLVLGFGRAVRVELVGLAAALVAMSLAEARLGAEPESRGEGRIAFAFGESGADHPSQLAVMDPNGKHRRALPADNVTGLSWSPGTRGQAGTTLRSLIALGLPIYCGGRKGKEIALTFDDGPGPWTETALRILRRAHDRATFFVIGRRAAAHPALVRQEARMGHDVGEHTWTHPYLPALPPTVARHEIERTRRTLRRLLGRRVVFFRPPYGASTPGLNRFVKKRSLLQILWSVDTRDSEGADPAQIYAAIVAGARPGAIILMHENRGQTLKGLHWRHALRALHARRLHPVTLTQLLMDDPPSRAQVEAGPRGCGSGKR